VCLTLVDAFVDAESDLQNPAKENMTVGLAYQLAYIVRTG